MKTVFSSRVNALLCALLFVVCALAALPFAETGVNDDWSYIRSAQLLASTGHIVYVGWASAMLGWQLFIGALFIKIFGFSFSATRGSMILVAALTAYLLHRIFLRLGLHERNAVFATLTFVLSPLFLPVGTSFMSDGTGVFCTVLCLYLCLRSFQATTDRAAFLWLAIASLSTAIGGTARQTVWFGVFLMVPSTFWLIRRRRPPAVASGIVWLASLGIIYASVRWFSHQPYSLREAVIAGYVDRDLAYHTVANVARATIEMSLFLLPVLIAFIERFPFRNRQILRYGVAFAVLLGLSALYLGHRFPASTWLAPFDIDGNFVSPGGLVDVPEIGRRPLVINLRVQIALTLVTIVAALAFLGFAWDTLKKRETSIVRPSGSSPIPTWQEIFILVGPFSLGYLAILMHRAIFNTVYDRYLLPLLFIALGLILRFYQERIGPRLPASCYVTLLLFTIFGVAGTHDVFAGRRARVIAADRLIAAGIPRTAFYGGFEYDGWTQVVAMGFANSGYIIMPDGFHAERPVPRHMGSVKPCNNRFAQYDPVIEPRYGLSFDQTACDGSSAFAPVTYRAWLPPFTRLIYIRSVTQKPF